MVDLGEMLLKVGGRIGDQFFVLEKGIGGDSSRSSVVNVLESILD